MIADNPTFLDAMSAASANVSKTAGDSPVAAPITELSVSELDALIARVEQAKQAQLCLSADDCDLLLNAVLTLATMQERLSHNDLTITKMKKLLGIVRSSEQTRNLFPGAGGSDSADEQSGAPGTADVDARTMSCPSPDRPHATVPALV